MPWDFGAGVAAAAGAGAGLIGDSIKRERDLQGATDLEALKQKIEQDKQARVAAVLASVSRTKDVPIAGPTVDGSSLGVETQPKPEGEYRRERGDALSKAGLIDYSEKEYTAADRHEENMFNRTTQAAKQKSDDEKWHAQFEQQAAYNKAHLAIQGAQLGLKAQEKKDFDAAADDYSESKAQYDELVAKRDKPELISAAKQAMDRAALSLKQYRVDVGDVAPSQLRLQIATGINSAEKVIKDLEFATDPESVAARDEAKATRRTLIKQMGMLAGGETTTGSADDIRYDAKGNAYKKGPDGKPVLITGAAKPTPTAAAATMPAPSVLAKPYVPQTPEEARLSMQGGATAADRIGSIIDSVKDVRKKTGADKY